MEFFRTMQHQRSGEDSTSACACPHNAGSATAGGANDHHTLEALQLVRDVLLAEDWLVERPPLALAFAHPYIRLWCEMWHTEYVGDLHAPAAYGLPMAEPPHSPYGRGRTGSSAPPASFVNIGLHRLRNPIAFGDPSSAASERILSGSAPPTSSSVLPSSPHTTAAQRTVRSLVAPVLTYAEPVDVMTSEQLYDVAAVRGIPVVDPTEPLFALETYTEHVFRMPIGVKLGHVRLLTLWLPCESPSHATPVRRRARLVRGLFTHVPASVTHGAAMKASACIHTAGAQQAVRREPRPIPAPVVALQHVKGSCGGVTAVNVDTDSGAAMPDDSDSSAERGSAHMEAESEGDDWEAMALEEEVLLAQQPLSVSTATVTTTSRRSDSSGPQVTPRPRTCLSLSTTHHPLLPAASSSTTATASTNTGTASAAAVASEPCGGASAVIEGVCVALPPPCGWWLRRGVGPLSSSHSAPLPLYAHCVDATRQWLDWLEVTGRCTSDALPHEDGGSAAKTFLCGVSLSGWSSKYVQPTIVSPAEFVQRSVSVKLEDAISSTLPLRGLHVETSAVSLKRLLGGRCGERGDPSGSAAFLGTLVALDAPYLRDAEPDLCAARDRLPTNDDGDAGSLASALRRLRRLRFLCMNHGRDVLEAVPSQAPGRMDALSASVVELLLHGVTGLSAHTLASVGRCCVSLRTVDLTSTSVTDDELHALVYGILETPCKDSKPATCPATLSPLACLEDVRLTACRGVTCVSALAALPRLRRLDLRASGVRQVSDLVGCRLLEEVVLTRCEHVAELCPLWQLPRLRCVEADGVRQLQQHRALIPPAASAAEEDERADTCLVAPLVRLNLSQASVIRGASVGYLARRLLDWSGRFTSLMVLLLDYTDADDDTLRALAGFPTQESGPGRFMERCLPVASSLRELSLVGCTRVRHLGPLGVLPQLTRLMAAHSGVEHVDGLQYSRTLECLSLSHCTRVGSISPLAYAASLRCADLSHTPLNDAALLRFVYPTVVERGTAQQYSRIDKVGALLQVCSVFPTPLVPSQVEELRLRHCTSLLHISCVAHLPRLRRLDVCHTTVFDRSFVGFFSCTRALLRTQLWLTAHATGIAVDDGEVSEAAPLPDEEALLTAWRRDTEAVVAMPQDTSAASGEIDGGGTVVTAGGPLHTAEFDFAVGAVNTLTHVCLAYCMEVRCIAPFALFPQLVSLDVTGTVVDSASLLTFVNVLLEGCRCRTPDVPLMRLELEGNRLRPRALPTRQRGAAPVVSLFTRGSDARAAAVEPPRRCRRPFTLTTLTLAWCDYLTDVRCCAAVPSLRHLDVCGTPVDNASVAAFSPEAFALVSAASEEEAQWWHNHRCSLLSLDVSYCCRVTDIASLFASPAHPLPGSRSGSGGKRASSGDCPPFSLMELRFRHSGVMSTKEELRSLDPFGRCVLL